MNVFKTDFQGLLKDTKKVAAVRQTWKSGEFRLALETKVLKRPSIGTWFTYAILHLLTWVVQLRGGSWRMFGMLVIASDKHVRAALKDDTGRFLVTAGPDQRAMFGSPPNLMGVDGAEHQLQREVFSKVLFADDRDISAKMQEVAGSTAQALLDDARGKIDAIEDLLVPVLVETARVVHGTPYEDPNAYMTWTLRAAEQFVWPFSSSQIAKRMSFEAARRLRTAHLNAVRGAQTPDIPSSTLDHFVKLRDDNAVLGKGTAFETEAGDFLTDKRLANMLMGFSFTLATQFLPDSHALNRVLKSTPLRLKAAEFARDGNRKGMRKLVQECFRLHPATYPWVARRINLEDGALPYFIDGIELHHDETVLICIPAALRDPAVWTRPNRFDLDRDDGDIDLAFGVGAHRCMGRDMAETIATEVFMALFAREDVRRTGPMVGREATLLPARLPVAFTADAPQDGQVVATTVIPVRLDKTATARKAAELTRRMVKHLEQRLGRAPHFMVRRRLVKRAGAWAQATELAAARKKIARALDVADQRVTGDTAQDLIWARMEKADNIHGFGVTLVDLTVKRYAHPHIVIEFNADGPVISAAARADAFAAGFLQEALAAAGWSEYSLKWLFQRFGVATSTRLFGNSGLGVFGLPEASVAEIKAERELADFAERALDATIAAGQMQNVPIEALNAVRDAVRNAEGKDAKLAKLIHRPRARAPSFAAHTDKTFKQAMIAWAQETPWVKGVIAITAALIIVPAALATASLQLSGWFTILLAGVAFSVAMTVIWGVLLGIAAAWFWGQVKNGEATEEIDERQPALEKYGQAMMREDKKGAHQNHMALVVTPKPGLARRIILGFSIWIIDWMNRHWFRPGWAQDIGSIRHARFVRPAGASEGIFLSSFDGSWSSYIGEFSDRATQGMSIFWSNFTGFPRTHNLIGEGARDDERFKRWVRTRQVPASIVRQRFPDMSNDRIRRNSLIREGLARVLTRSEAESWLRLFGSDPRTSPDTIALDETQTILFKSLGGFPASACVVVQIAEGKQDAFRAALQKLCDPATGTDIPLLSFGERPTDRSRPAVSVGLSARGLEKLDLPADVEGRPHPQLYHFPMCFVEGMGRRSRTLDDPDPVSDDKVSWIDRAAGHGDGTLETDAVFMVAAASTHEDADIAAARDAAVTSLVDLLKQEGAITRDPKIVDTKLTPPTNAEGDVPKPLPGLGFADGISQPLLAGAPGVPENSPFQIAPGEFILGLPDEKGLRAPTPDVPAGWDVWGDLPDAAPLPDAPWPNFAAPKSAARDFGRHGSFMVIRQLEVDSDAFHTRFDTGPGGEQPLLPDDDPTKIIGRRRDGSPIGSRSFDVLDGVSAQGRASSFGSESTLSSDAPMLKFGARDPWGNDVPLGAHVRRANPRDSLGGPQGETRDRHRIIRRGRPYYEKNADSGLSERKGLLFVCLNASIERQFEFVQQTWLNARNFHGLFNEPDPLMGQERRQFTIPTPDGPRKIDLEEAWVKFRGGGYFFVPSKSALRALTRKRNART